LLIASAKNTFDTQSGQVKRITSDIILLDGLLAQYGPEATPIRGLMRNVVPACGWPARGMESSRERVPSATLQRLV
jgi:hypothetical protein